MKNFNMNRFALLMRSELVGNRKTHIRMTATMLIACFVVLIIILLKPSVNGFVDVSPAEVSFYEEMYINKAVDGMLIVAFFLMMVAFPSLAFSHLSTKQKRISEMMRPGTALEKYLVRLLLTVVIYPLLFLLMLVVADLLRMLVFPLFGHGLPAMFPDFFSVLGNGFSEWFSCFSTEKLTWNIHGEIRWYYKFWVCVTSAGVLLMLHSFFVLGSAVFRRYAAIFTCLVLLGLQLIFGLIASSVAVGRVLSINDNGDFLILSVIIWTIVIVCYGLSYRMYKHIQVIPRKWFKK